MVRRSPRRGEHMVHQPRQKLHRHILEGEGGAVKQLERECVGAELAQRRDRGMAERAVGLACHAGEIGFADRISGETPDDLAGDFGVGAAGKPGDRRRFEPRPGLGHIEPAVAGEAREHGFGETERGGFAPGRNVTQPTPSLSPGRPPGHLSY